MNELCGVNKQRNRRVALGFRFHPGELNTEIGSMEGIKNGIGSMEGIKK